ncbi:MAG: Lrp/AsnC ligand binding domain-containing protein, partial [Desulfurococcaceae archaeon]
KDYVKYLALTTGDHDIMVTIWARSAEDLEKIHDEIRNFEGVVSVYPMIVSEVIKDEMYT